MTYQRLIILLLVFGTNLLQSTVIAQTGITQTSFSMETPIEKPYVVPRYVLQQMDLEESRANRVTGSLIWLNGDGKADLLVQGDDGANITGYWVFLNVNNRWEMMFSTRAFTLIIEKNRTNGLADISEYAMTAVTQFGAKYYFDLEDYVPVECWTKDLKKTRSKAVFIKCEQ